MLQHVSPITILLVTQIISPFVFATGPLFLGSRGKFQGQLQGQLQVGAGYQQDVGSGGSENYENQYPQQGQYQQQQPLISIKKESELTIQKPQRPLLHHVPLLGKNIHDKAQNNLGNALDKAGSFVGNILGGRGSSGSAAESSVKNNIIFEAPSVQYGVAGGPAQPVTTVNANAVAQASIPQGPVGTSAQSSSQTNLQYSAGNAPQTQTPQGPPVVVPEVLDVRTSAKASGTQGLIPQGPVGTSAQASSQANLQYSAGNAAQTQIPQGPPVGSYGPQTPYKIIEDGVGYQGSPAGSSYGSAPSPAGGLTIHKEKSLTVSHNGPHHGFHGQAPAQGGGITIKKEFSANLSPPGHHGPGLLQKLEDRHDRRHEALEKGFDKVVDTFGKIGGNVFGNGGSKSNSEVQNNIIVKYNGNGTPVVPPPVEITADAKAQSSSISQGSFNQGPSGGLVVNNAKSQAETKVVAQGGPGGSNGGYGNSGVNNYYQSQAPGNRPGGFQQSPNNINSGAYAQGGVNAGQVNQPGGYGGNSNRYPVPNGASSSAAANSYNGNSNAAASANSNNGYSNAAANANSNNGYSNAAANAKSNNGYSNAAAFSNSNGGNTNAYAMANSGVGY